MTLLISVVFYVYDACENGCMVDGTCATLAKCVLLLFAVKPPITKSILLTHG